jgi:pyrroloquinoline quinone (PQQ) biosynthesis protein C
MQTVETGDQLLGHPVFRWFAKGELDEVPLMKFAEQYYLLSEAFRRFLVLALANVPDELAQCTLVSNLWDEYGRGRPERFHRRMLLRFMCACGLGDPLRFTPLPSTLTYISEMTQICSSEEAGRILGALGPGCEDTTKAQYGLILEGLYRCGRFSDSELEFFKDHVAHDDAHAHALEDAIGRWAAVHGRTAVEEGKVASLSAEWEYWNGVWASMSSGP